MYIAIFLPLLIVLLMQGQNNKVLIKRITKSKIKGEKFLMLELAKKFIDKECLIYTFNSQLTGVIKEVNNGAILVENKNTIEIVNLDFVVRIREYPKGKSGKKKSFILD